MTEQDDYQINVWAQMFFDDGSVSQGKRYPCTVLEDELGELRQIAIKFLTDTCRTEGFLLVWGAGAIWYRHYVLDNNFTSSSSGL